MLTKAMNFAIDCQALAQKGELNKGTFAGLVHDYGYIRQEGTYILVFPDTSMVEGTKEGDWRIVEK